MEAVKFRAFFEPWRSFVRSFFGYSGFRFQIWVDGF